MELRDYLRVLRRGWPLVLALAVVGTSLGLLYAVTSTPIYQADVQVFVATSGGSDASQLAQGSTFTQQRVQSYTSMANAPGVTEPVIRNHGLALTDSQLAAKITADAPQNKVIVNLHVTDTDARTAAQLANWVAEQFNRYVTSTEQTDARGRSVVKLTVIHPASVPTGPISPNKPLGIGLGLLVGLLLGVGIVFLRDLLDNTVNGPGDYERFDVAVLGNVPFDKRVGPHPIAFREDAHSARSEAYRQLRTNLHFVDIDHPPRIIAVTSALPGEGKTTTSINLAAALAEAGSRVCLIDADLRRPAVARTLGLVGDVGFTTALIGAASVADVLQNAGRNLAVLTSGVIPPNPSELLITDHARNIVAEIAATADYVVIDTPPLLPVTDAATVATIVDATLIVTRAGKTTREQAEQAIAALDKVGERPVGAVLNMVSRRRGSYGYEYSYYDSPAAQARRDDHVARHSDESDPLDLFDDPENAPEPAPSVATPAPSGRAAQLIFAPADPGPDPAATDDPDEIPASSPS